MEPDDDDHLADCVDLDEADDEEWALMACSMGRDGQCGQAGSEWCDFECPVMRSIHAESQRKQKK
jgi:hypothetical protein